MVMSGSAGIVSAQVALPEVVINRPEGLTRVIAAFKNIFKSAREPRWFYGGKNYAVTFLMNDLKYNALFMDNGDLIYQISYGQESAIPARLKRQVFRKFKNYRIISVINVQQEGKDIWYIIGEGRNEFLNVNIKDGVMSKGTKSRKYEQPVRLVSLPVRQSGSTELQLLKQHGTDFGV